jgi:peptidoglycan/LPS O-acetylase OafA/YrhL
MVYVVVSIALAELATRFIDRPSIRLSRLVTRPWRKAKEERPTFCEQKVAKKL